MNKSSLHILLLILLSIGACTCALAQDLSNQGKEFWVGYGHCFSMEPEQADAPAGSTNNGQEMVLYFSTRGEAADITVTVNNTIWMKNYHVPANSVMQSDYMPKGLDITGVDSRLFTTSISNGNGSEDVFPDHGIHIVSSAPIVAYAHIFNGGSSGATMLMPVDTWGYSYYSVNTKLLSKAGYSSWSYVIANHDNTAVEIIPSTLTRTGHQAGVPFTITLNKGEIYQILSSKLNDGPGPDMSGTRFRSIANNVNQCYPIAVFSGSSLTAAPLSCGSGFADNDIQQVFPTQAWGKRYLTAPTSSAVNPAIKAVNGYKVLVNDPSTIVKVNGQPLPLSGLSNNIYYLESNTADLIEADKPIMVTQLITGGGGCNTGGGNINDPDMINISPVDQGIEQIGFFRNNRWGIKFNYLTMIVPNGGTGLSSLRIDGQPLSAAPASEYTTYVHPQMSGYTVVVRRWKGFNDYPDPPPGQCVVTSDSAFTAITYGLGNAESYAYNAGAHINNLSARSFIHNTLNTNSDHNLFTCVDAPVTISALIAYQPTKIVWKLSALAGVITPAMDVTDNAPVSTQTVVINGATYYRYSLPVPYTFTAVDTFYLPILLTNQVVEKCDHTEEIKLKIEVREKPKADFSFVHRPDCSLDTIRVAGMQNALNGAPLQSWDWAFPGGTTASGINATTHMSAGVNRWVVHSVVTTDGCVADTSKRITIYAPPTATLDNSVPALCEKASTTFTGTATYEGNGGLQWYWDPGNGTTQTTTTNSTQPVTYNTAGNYTVKLVVKASDVCISDTATMPVTINSNPQVNIVYPEGCLPQDGIVNFSNSTTIPAGQTITSHQWNFGDAHPPAGYPNTSTEISPSHKYTSFGTYSISYRAESSKGCITDTSFKATFNLAPVLTYSALASVCEQEAPVSVAKAGVSNNVPGAGVYKGDGTTAAGLFTPATAGAGLHTIWYVYTATSGCIDSISQTIQVYPTPDASFTLVNNICAGTATTLTSTAAAPTGSTITSWEWKFGSSAPIVKTTGAAFDQVYPSSGSYQITLAVASDHNCVSAPNTQTLVVQPLPIAGFDTPDSICMPGGVARFTNKSTISSNSALNYNWDFGDGTGTSTAVNPTHVYATARINGYDVRLTTTSAYGCKDDATKPTDRFSNRPVAAFTANPQEICQGAEIAFQDQSTATGTTIKSWSWQFGDGTTATTQTPTKTYDRAEPFTVILVVKNAEGCASSPATLPVTVHKQPVIDAGPSLNVRAGEQVQLNATSNATSYTFQWVPATGLSDAAILRPYLTVTGDVTYTLTAIGEFNCKASDDITVKLLRNIEPPNVFTPNGDGIHDLWEIPYLADYADAVVDIYNRYGQSIYHVKGYAKPWDGRVNGKEVPAGTYYYIINLGTGAKSLTGSVTIIR